MSSIDDDIEKLEHAIQRYARTLKRPQHWAKVVALSGVAIDRPAATILHILQLAYPHRLRVQDVAAQLGIEAPSVTRKTQELEAAGYITRLPDEKDGRAIGLEMTANGRALTSKLWKLQRQPMIDVISRWSEKDRHTFINLFERFSTDLADTQISNTHYEKEES